MSNPGVSVLLAVVVLLVAGCGGGTQAGCDPVGDLDFVCGPVNAEDLVLAPDTDWIISSSMAPGGGFYLVDSTNGDWSELSFESVHDADTFPGCASPPVAAEFESHGLSIRETSNDSAMLYAVGHGGREAVEVFEVDTGGSRPDLTWVGCVPMPDGLAANSVTSTTDGTILATVLFMPGTTFADAVVAQLPTGVVLRWSPGDGAFTRLAGSELPANNGIEVSADGNTIYVASSGYQTIVAYSNTNPVRFLGATRQLPITPDNVHMGANGRLLTAGMKNDVPECGGPPGPDHDLDTLAACPRGSIVIEIDPNTMQDRVLVETPAVDVFSNATMALVRQGEFWIGTFSGSRIAHGRLP